MGKKCFVIAPLGALNSDTRRRTDQICNKVIIPTLKKLGYDYARSDMFKTASLINHEIIRHLIDDDLVIADLTGQNPNVFYELGIRHAVNKPCILLRERTTLLPFDIASIRAISFDFGYDDSMKDCKGELIDFINYIEQHPEDNISPIQVALALKAYNKDQAQKELFTQMFEELREIKTDLQKITVEKQTAQIEVGDSTVSEQEIQDYYDEQAAIAAEENAYQEYFRTHGYYPDQPPDDEVPSDYELEDKDIPEEQQNEEGKN